MDRAGVPDGGDGLVGSILGIFPHGPVYLANFGLVASAVLVSMILTLVGMMSSVIKGTEG